MGGLIKALSEEAEAQRDKILADAKAESREIIRQAEATVEDLQQKSFNDCDDKLRVEKGRILGGARLQSRNLAMQAKHEVLEQAFKRAISKLANLRNQREYIGLFNRLASEVLDEFGGDDKDKIIVFVDARDIGLCHDFFDSRRIPYEIDTSKTFLGGLEITSSDISFKVSNTLEGRLARKKNGLLGKLATILFES